MNETQGATPSQIRDGLGLELRRGVLVLAVLSQLDHPEYGYSLLRGLADGGLDVDQGTLYPLLRRLEGQGLLTSTWEIADGSRPRRYYVTSELGKEVLAGLREDWARLADVIGGFMEGTKEVGDGTH